MKLRKVITTAGFIMASITPANAQLYMCKSCPAGTYSDGTFTSCKNCLTTGVANCDSVTGKVTSCKGGYKYSTTKLDQAAYDRCVSMCRVANCRTYCYSTQGVQKTVAPYCDACPAGTWSSQGASSCTTCGTGYYSTGTATACLSCLTTGVATCDSTTGKATNCKPGYGYSNGKCTVCSSGYYSAGGTSSCSNSWTNINTYYMPGWSGTGIPLNAGAYKVELKGAGGGGGGGDQGDGKGGKGGNGAYIVKYFYLPTASSYNFYVGKGGTGGLGVVNAESNTEAKGGNGEATSFSISGIISITAGGGEGGYGGVRGTKGAVDGAAGSNAGNGQGGTGGAGGINDKGVGNEARSGKNGSSGLLQISILNPCSKRDII